MALTIKQLDSDTSFLLSFEPIFPSSVASDVDVDPRPFTILLDPVITNPSSLSPGTPSHSTSATDAKPVLSSSLSRDLTVAPLPSELPEPDLVIISQYGSDHCDEATLRQLPGSGTRTLILAEPTAARIIRGWRHFDRDRVQVLERWEDTRFTGNMTAVVRVPVPVVAKSGHPGEVTVSFVTPDKKQKKQKISCGLSTAVSAGAIGITYRPPSIPSLQPNFLEIAAAQKQKQKQGQNKKAVHDATPPTTPEIDSSVNGNGDVLTKTMTVSAQDTDSMICQPSSPRVSRRSLRSVQSTSTLLPSPTQAFFTPATTAANNNNNNHLLIRSDPKSSSQQAHASMQQQRPSSSSPSTATTVGSNITSAQAAAVAAAAASRRLSVIFAPHGTAFPQIAAWTSSHLLAEAALPLTALLHPMDGVTPLRNRLSYQRSPWSATLLWLRLGIGSGSSHNNTRSSIVCAGADITSRLSARAWVSTHDGGEGRAMPPRLSHDMSSLEADADTNADQKVTDQENESDETNHELREQKRVSSSTSSSKKRAVEMTQIVRLGSGDEVVVCADGVLPALPPRVKAQARTESKTGGGGDEDKTKSWAQDLSITAASTDQQDKDKKGVKKSINNDDKPVIKVDFTSSATKTKEVPESKTKGVPEIKPTIAVHTSPVNDKENPIPKKKLGLRTKASMMRLGLKLKSG